MIKTRILIVDDEPDIRDLLREALELEGYSATTAGGGERAVELAEVAPFDFALLDVMMPGMDGFETLKALKTLRPGMRVIVISAYAGDQLIREMISAGAVAALTKPIDFSSLFDIIAEK